MSPTHKWTWQLCNLLSPNLSNRAVCLRPQQLQTRWGLYRRLMGMILLLMLSQQNWKTWRMQLPHWKQNVQSLQSDLAEKDAEIQELKSRQSTVEEGQSNATAIVTELDTVLTELLGRVQVLEQQVADQQLSTGSNSGVGRQYPVAWLLAVLSMVVVILS